MIFASDLKLFQVQYIAQCDKCEQQLEMTNDGRWQLPPDWEFTKIGRDGYPTLICAQCRIEKLL